MNINPIINSMLQMLPKNNLSPMAANFINMLQHNDMKGIEQMATNILQSNNKTFEQAKQDISNKMNLR